MLEATKPHNKNELIYYNMKTWPSGSALTEVRGGGTNKHPQDFILSNGKNYTGSQMANFAFRYFNLDYILNITADCPLISFECISNIIKYYKKEKL